MAAAIIVFLLLEIMVTTVYFVWMSIQGNGLFLFHLPTVSPDMKSSFRQMESGMRRHSTESRLRTFKPVLPDQSPQRGLWNDCSGRQMGLILPIHWPAVTKSV